MPTLVARPQGVPTLVARPRGAPTLVARPQSAPTLVAGAAPGAEAEDRGLLAGRYLLRRQIGRGGMGTVYEAWDEQQGATVALKVLQDLGPAGAVALKRFHREAELARRIEHPNVARVYELGTYQGRTFLTMEYVEGEDLRGRLAREAAMEVEEAARLAWTVCEALGAAHSAGVVHRDLKPANVLLARNGRVVLTDFGIARAMEEPAEGGLTHLYGMVGTPQYMAPEQLTEEPVDARTDVYAVGLLLYEMLVGAPAFEQATSLKAAFERLSQPPPDPRQCRAVPAELAELVQQCLARAPAQRPATASQVASTLKAWLAE